MKSELAFEVLLNGLRQALKTAQEQGKQAFEQGRFGEAAEFSKRCQELRAQIKSLEDMQGKWQKTVVPAPATLPALPSTPTPETAFRLPILRVLRNLGGSAPYEQVLDRVGEMMRPTLNSLDQKLLNGLHPTWRNNALWEGLTMLDAGLIRTGALPRTWEITEAGRQLLEGKRPDLSVKPAPSPVASVPVPVPAAPPPPSAAKKRLRRGKLVPRAVYRQHLLIVLGQLGGRGSVTDVLDQLETLMRPLFTDLEYECLSDGTLRWQVSARYERQYMVEQGWLRNDSPRGLWELSEKGWQALLEGKAALPTKLPTKTAPAPASRSVKAKPSKHKRIGRGECVPYATYRRYILLSLDDLGGRAPVRQVLERVEAYLKPQFKEADYQPLSDGSPRWQVAARFERKNMVISGLLRDDSLHGIWELSEAGREEVKKHR